MLKRKHDIMKRMSSRAVPGAKFIFFMPCLLIFLLSGCGKSSPYPDLQQYMDRMKQQQAGMIQSLHKLDVKPPIAVIYDGNMRRSPFENGQVVGGAAKAISTNPLQAYSLSMLRLLGTVTENGATFAYITTPDNMVYRVQVGDIIGDHYGKIVNIQPSIVNVMELDTDNPDEHLQRVVSLKLRNEN